MQQNIVPYTRKNWPYKNIQTTKTDCSALSTGQVSGGKKQQEQSTEPLPEQEG